MHHIESSKPLSWIGYLAGTTIGCFAVVRFVQGEYELALLDAVLSTCLLCLSIFVQITHNTVFVRYGVAIIGLTGCLATLHLNPQTGIQWLYVATTAFYVVLKVPAALTANALLIIGTLLVLQGSQYPIPYLSLLTTLGLINVFSFLFAINIERYSQQWEQLSREDELTGVGNRRAFQIHADDILRKYKQKNMVSSLIYIDVDHFKLINDEHGHGLGDAVLKTVVNIIQNSLRETDTLYRLGGDEFVVIAERTSLQPAAQVAERLRQEIEHNEIANQPVSLSIGIAETKHRDNVDSWMKRADDALYQAKEGGRNRVAIETHLTHIRQDKSESSKPR